MSPEADLYEVIGGSASEDAASLRRRYLAEARRVHPDVGPPEERAAREARMRALNGAWAVLSDPRRRADYDRSCGVANASFVGTASAASTEAPSRPFRPFDTSDDEDWDDALDTPVPGTEVRPWAQFIPLGLAGGAVVTLGAALLLRARPLVGIAVMLGFGAVLGFLMLPLLAMLSGARAERGPGSRRRR